MKEKVPHNAVQGYADLPDGKINSFFHFKVKDSFDACLCLDRLENRKWRIRKAYFQGHLGNNFLITERLRKLARLNMNLNKNA